MRRRIEFVVPGTCRLAAARSFTAGEKKTFSCPSVDSWSCCGSPFVVIFGPSAGAVDLFGVDFPSEISSISGMSDLVRSTGLPTQLPGSLARRFR